MFPKMLHKTINFNCNLRKHTFASTTIVHTRITVRSFVSCITLETVPCDELTQITETVDRTGGRAVFTIETLLTS